MENYHSAEAMADSPLPRAEAGWRYTPHVVVFFSSAFIMVLELVAGRLIARHLGSSLYTWTSIIGIILAGISLGNYLGGRLADRWRPKAMLGALFLFASLCAFLVLPLNYLFSTYDLVDKAGGWLANLFWRTKDWEASWPTKTFASVFAIFFLPAFILGTISPVAAKMALAQGSAIGQTIGSVCAWGAVGSIIGTFLTGFWLVAALGAQGVAMFVVAGLALMAAITACGWWRIPAAAWAVIALFIFALSQMPAGKIRARLNAIPKKHAQFCRCFLEVFASSARARDADFAKDSNYQYVYVYKTQSKKDPKREIKILRLDYLIHSYVDPDDPEHLEYGYEGIYREVVERFFGDHASLSAFFLGGGGYSFPRWLRARWPEVAIDVAEIDPVVVEANHTALGLRGDAVFQGQARQRREAGDMRIWTFVGDARNVLDDRPEEAKYDLVVGDAFNDLSVPFHLTTYEFNQKVKAHLKAGGVYLVNVIDDWEFADLLAAYVNTLRLTWAYVYVLCTEEEGVKKGRDTFVLAASDVSIDTDDWLPGHWQEFPGSILNAVQMENLLARGNGRILTDDDAPVENMLAPVVAKRR